MQQTKAFTGPKTKGETRRKLTETTRPGLKLRMLKTLIIIRDIILQLHEMSSSKQSPNKQWVNEVVKNEMAQTKKIHTQTLGLRGRSCSTVPTVIAKDDSFIFATALTKFFFIAT